MDIFNKSKIEELKYTIRVYKERNAQLEPFEQKLKDAELKIKVMQMLIDDDDAVLELLEAIKVKPLADSQHKYFNSAAAQQDIFGRGSAGMSGLSGMRLAGIIGLSDVRLNRVIIKE